MIKAQKDKEYYQLCIEVQKCMLCKRMKDSARVLNGSAGSLNATIMFIGEAPGRLGADGSEIPFHGDKSGDNFETLLSHVGISRYQIFVTNAVLCNPKDDKGNNSTPNSVEMNNCSGFLKKQIELIDPDIVVTLGATALKSLNTIEKHFLHLRESVRKSIKWHNRILIPLYHPGQRALIHRSFTNQLADYQYVAEQSQRIGKPKRKVSSNMKEDVFLVANLITSLKPEISYFALHKLFYLVECEYANKTGNTLTGAYFIRQKDGPYCTDLHIRKLKNSFEDLHVKNKRGIMYLYRNTPTLFDHDSNTHLGDLNNESHQLITKVVEKYGNKSNSDLKTSVYLTKPMKQIIKSENKGVNLFNSPIRFTENY